MSRKLLQGSAGVTATLLVLLLAHFLYTPDQVRSERVFVYGSLTSPIVRSIICGCVATTSQAALSDYSKVGRTIIPNEQSEVPGLIFYASDWELGWFDWYERTPDYYRRERIEIAGEPAWVYIKNE